MARCLWRISRVSSAAIVIQAKVSHLGKMGSVYKGYSIELVRLRFDSYE